MFCFILVNTWICKYRLYLLEKVFHSIGCRFHRLVKFFAAQPEPGFLLPSSNYNKVFFLLDRNSTFSASINFLRFLWNQTCVKKPFFASSLKLTQFDFELERAWARARRLSSKGLVLKAQSWRPILTWRQSLKSLISSGLKPSHIGLALKGHTI